MRDSRICFTGVSTDASGMENSYLHDIGIPGITPIRLVVTLSLVIFDWALLYLLSQSSLSMDDS